MNETRRAPAVVDGVSRQWIDVLLGLSGGPVAKLVNAMSISILGVELSAEARVPIDQRLARLDDARSALSESLIALDELQAEAERSKVEHARARAALENALSSRKDAEHQLAEVRAIMDTEVSAFQVVAGVPNVRKERFIGLIIGITASAIFSGAVWLANALIERSRLFG